MPPLAVNGVVFKKIDHIFQTTQVIHSNDFYLRPVPRNFQKCPADPAETIDAHSDFFHTLKYNTIFYLCSMIILLASQGAQREFSSLQVLFLVLYPYASNWTSFVYVLCL